MRIHPRIDDTRIAEELWVELEEGDRWECIRCTDCCARSWRINLTWKEYDRIRSDPRFDEFRVEEVEVDETTGLSHPFFEINGKCPLLDVKKGLCTVYPDWPYTCAIYPFLYMPDGRILKDPQCRGFGHGPIVDREKLLRKIQRERARAGMPSIF